MDWNHAFIWTHKQKHTAKADTDSIHFSTNKRWTTLKLIMFFIMHQHPLLFSLDVLATSLLSLCVIPSLCFQNKYTEKSLLNLHSFCFTEVFEENLWLFFLVVRNLISSKNNLCFHIHISMAFTIFSHSFKINMWFKSSLT